MKHCQLNQKLAEQIELNPSFILMLQHLDVDFCVGDKTLKHIAEELGINEYLLLAIGDLYYGNRPTGNPIKIENDIKHTVRFLKNSHRYYRNEKYPEILGFIRELQQNHSNAEVQLLEKFFMDYFQEVKEHLNYEDNVAFPYFLDLVNKDNKNSTNYTAREYSEHHTDIELKLKDLKNLLLKHIHINEDLALRRKLLLSIFELGQDLYIHSLIEETILIPGAKSIESKNNGNL